MPDIRRAALWIHERTFQWVTIGVMGLQCAIGPLGVILHVTANLHGVEPTIFGRFVYGAPAFAPLLFPNVALLAVIPLWDRLAEN